MEYKRFTHNPDNIDFSSPCYLCKHKDEMPKRNKRKCSMAECDYLKCYEKLSDLEDKIEQGTLIELPCKVGDTIYVPYQYDGVEGISFHKIYQIVIMENDIYVDFEVDTDIDYVFAYIYNFGKFNIAWLNKKFFLTKEEAEKKLKELQK